MAAPTTLLYTVGLLLFLSAALNVTTVYRLHGLSSAYASFSVQHLPSELPLSVDTAALEFVFRQHYNIENDTDWATLVPPHHGRVKLREQEFDIGMYTDMECLDTIRAAYVAMRGGTQLRSEAAEACLGQIRQAILCTADPTLERTTIVCKDGVCPLDGAVATGNHVDHKCRDWTQVRAFVEDNQAAWAGNMQM